MASWSDLLEMLQRPELQLRPWCKPSSTQDALEEIVRALVAETELKLIDEGSEATEVTAVRFPAGRLNEIRSVPGRRDLNLEQLTSLVAGDSRTHIGLFTSGSTGKPKLVRHSLKTLARDVRRGPAHRGDVWGFAYSPTHIGGVQVFLQALANGNTIVDLGGLDPKGVVDVCERHGVTHLSATPTFFRLVLPAAERGDGRQTAEDGGQKAETSGRVLPKVRSVTLGGESSDAGLLGRLRGFFPNARLHNVYASTEAGTLLVADGEFFEIPEALHDRIQIRNGTLHVHRSLLGEFVSQRTGDRGLRTEDGGRRAEDRGRTAEDGGQRAEDGETVVGETVGGFTVSQSHRSTASPSHRFTASPIAWYATGDVVEIVSAAPLRFRITGREDSIVNVGGNKVNPTEVEQQLLQHPAVRSGRVYGRSNSVLGQVLCAEVVGDSGLSETDLRHFLALRLPEFKIPRLINVVDQLQYTRTGKVKRQ